MLLNRRSECCMVCSPTCVCKVASTSAANSQALSLDYDSRAFPTSSPHVASSYADGSLQIHKIADGELRSVSEWKGHTLEAWIVVFNPRDPCCLLSGADDAWMRVWDTRMALERSVMAKRFDMGVTTAQFHPQHEHVVAVGSYDEHVRLFDTRNVKRPLAECYVGGGVWRTKFAVQGDSRDTLLVASMHAGAHILRIDPQGNSEVLANDDGFESMCYGADWCLDPSFEGTAVTCSFYDRKVHTCHFQA